MTRLSVFLLCAFAATVAAAEPAPLAAVGRLDLDGRGACSGTLVAPDLVLTAAHCLVSEADRRKLVGDRIAFRPGRSPGLPAPESYPGRIAAVHPVWGFGIGPMPARMGFDFGLLRLAAPVPDTVARPLALGALPRLGDFLFIAGYRAGRGEVARQRRCEVIEANHAFAALGCEVDSGESGSPMLRAGRTGLEVVGVIANKGRIEVQPVAFGPVTATAYDTIAEHLRNLESLAAEEPGGGLDEAD